MRKSWLDGLGPRRSIPNRKQGEGLVRNDKSFYSSEHRDVHRKWGEEKRGRRERLWYAVIRNPGSTEDKRDTDDF